MINVLTQIKKVYDKYINIYISFPNDYERENNLHAKIAKVILNSTDPEALKNNIAREVATAFEASRCFFIEFDTNTNNFIKIKNAYSDKREYMNILGLDVEREIPNLSMKRKYLRTLLIEDIDKYVKENKLEDTPESAYFKEYNVKTLLSLRLEFGDLFLGAIVLHYDKKHKLNEFKLEFLKDISEHISIALYLSQLYAVEKSNKEKEKVLTSIISTMRTEYSLDEIAKKIIETLCTIYNCKRIFLNVELSDKKEAFLYKDMLFAKLTDINQINENTNIYHDNLHFTNNKPFIIKDTHSFIVQNNLENSELDAFFKDKEIKSLLLLPLLYENISYGFLLVEFSMAEFITNDNLDYISTITKQLSIAINQLQLNENEINQKNRENIFRVIMDDARSSLDIKEVRKKLINKIGAIFKADRCYFRAYTVSDDEFFSPEEEYLSSQNEKSLLNYIPSPIALEYFTSKVNMANNTHKAILLDSNSNDLKNDIREYLNEFGIKKDYAFPVVVSNNNILWLVMHYTKEYSGLSVSKTSLLETIVNQLDVTFNQIWSYLKAEKIAKRELVLRNITEKIRGSLDINETLQFICEEVLKLFNVQRVAIVQTNIIDNDVDKFIIKKEYKINEEIKGLTSFEFGPDIPRFWDETFSGPQNVLAIDNIINQNLPEYFKESYNKMGIKSLMGAAIRKGDAHWGTMVLSEYNSKRHWTDGEQLMLEIISAQVYVAIKQSELFETIKEKAEREVTIRKITEKIRSSLDINETLQFICEEVARLFNVQRVFIAKENISGKYQEGLITKEYKVSSYYEGIPNKNLYESLYNFWRDYLLKENKVIAINDISTCSNAEPFKSVYSAIGVKSVLGTSISKENEHWGAIILSEYKNIRIWTESEKLMLQIIAEQIFIALNQSELYEQIKNKAEREVLLRHVFEKMRSSLDIKEVKEEIVNVIGKTLNVDRCFIIEYDKDKEKYLIPDNEYLASNSFKSFKGYDMNIEIPALVKELRQGKELLHYNHQVFIDGIKLETAAEMYNVNNPTASYYQVTASMIHPLAYSNEFLGDLVIHYVDKKHNITQDEINLARILSEQISISLYQAKLFQKIQLQVEREKISRNIIEILRSSIDKIIIKKLFVKNIGKFFNADRVYFSDYSDNKKIYLPVDKNSEYLSNQSEKSFIGYDWSNSDMKDYIQPLLEKREIRILNWEEYLKQNPSKTEGFIRFCKDAEVKSSYDFPVVYQNKIIGYFGLDFTRDFQVLSDEDIGRIRSICTQAGVALYHADVYEKAQACNISENLNIKDFMQKFKNPTNEILDETNYLYQNEVDRTIQLEHLNNIIKSCNVLLELTGEY